MKPMNYRGYSARIEYADEEKIFVGRVVGIKKRVSFKGKSVDELRNKFQDAIEAYIESCTECGESPERPYSGKFMLRIPTEVHAAIAKAAEAKGKSLNQWVTDLLKQTIRA